MRTTDLVDTETVRKLLGLLYRHLPPLTPVPGGALLAQHAAPVRVKGAGGAGADGAKTAETPGDRTGTPGSFTEFFYDTPMKLLSGKMIKPFNPERVLEVQAAEYRNPRNRGVVPGADFAWRAENPECKGVGHRKDRVRLTVRFKPHPGEFPLDDEIIRDVRYTGKGCNLAMAAAQVLVRAMKGFRVGNVRAWDYDKVRELIDFEMEVRLDDEALKCATLALDAFHAGIREYERDPPPKA